nr:tenascin isoform X1 [Misgurnus anguillicaudatus]
MGFLFLFLLMALPSPALLSPDLQTKTQSAPRDVKPQPIKVVISDTCAQDGPKEREIDLDPDSPLVLTHQIRLVPVSGGGCSQCKVDFAALYERIETLEKEVSNLREKCGGSEGCCTSQQSKGPMGSTVRPTTDDCPDDCNNQGRCVDRKCVCFPGFSGPDCSTSECPDDCNNRGKCVKGQCVCDPGFTGPECSSSACPENCNSRGRCVNGRCVCDLGFTGPSCKTESCPENCNNHGRCVNSKCVCDTGFTGRDCSKASCSENCNNRGRCVNGQCVCNPGFTGQACSVKTCPYNCNNRGVCVNGKCVCEGGFTGPDCSSMSCPGNCSNRGKCLDSQCVCQSGFTGPDCSSKACPNNCNDKGRCVNGECVCDVGFSGQDCSAKTCPNNCSNRGRCVKGHCMCRRGFTGTSCSKCESGFTGDNCDTALLGVSQLSMSNITETSVSLFWTPPTVQYDTFLITFTSTKDTNQKITSKINGRLTTYTQTGLTAGQKYMVSITGAKEGMMGAESTAEFTTLISRPKGLQIEKTSTKSVIVKWEKAQGEIDRYVLSVTPNETSCRLPEVSRDYLPPERRIAQIVGLEPGCLYDISLVAEKDSVKSLPASIQATPGNTLKPADRMTMGTVTMHVNLDAVNNKEKGPWLTNTTTLLPRKQGLSTTNQATKGRSEDSDKTGNNTDLKTGIFIRPRQKRPLPLDKDRTLPKPGTSTDTIRIPYSPEIKHLNSTRIGLGRRRIVVPSSIKSAILNPVRPKTPDVDLTHHISDGKLLELLMKETQPDEGLHFRRPPFRIMRNGTTSPKYQKHIATSSTTPQIFSNVSDSTEEPTITTEKNLTAYINGTKCVRKVLVGYRKIGVHGNTTSEGNTQFKNLTVIVGHINGKDVLNKLLTGSSIVDKGGVRRLDEYPPTAETFEARRRVKEEAGEKDTEADKEKENTFAGIIKASSARQPETEDYPILTTTASFPNLSTQPFLAQPERVDQNTGDQSTTEGPPRKTSIKQLSIPRLTTKAQHPSSASPPLDGKSPLESTSSSQKGNHPSWSSSIASQASTPEPVQNSTTQSSLSVIKAPIKNNTVNLNSGRQLFGLMPFQRTPVRGSLRHHSFVSSFRNGSRQILQKPLYPYRGPIRRPLPSKGIIRNNRTLNQANPIQQVKPAIPAAIQNSTSIRIRPNTILNRSNGTTNRHTANRKSQIKHSDTTQRGPNINQYENEMSDISFVTDHLTEKINKTQEYVLNEPDSSIEKVRVNNVTSTGFVVLWEAPKGKFRHFVITHTELGEQNKAENVGMTKDQESKEINEDDQDNRNNEDESQKEVLEAKAAKKGSLNKEKSADHKFMPNVQSINTNKSGESTKKFTTVLPGSARSHRMINLSPQTRYSVSIIGKGPAFRSRTHNLIVHTGPEPPSNLTFSDVTDGSFTVSWAKTKSKVSGFKITYTNVQEGKPISVSVDSKTIRVALSKLSPGSTYEVSVRSMLGQEESDTIKDIVTTLPDTPSDLRAINITDSKALLLWRPTLATIDHYIIRYSSETAPGSGITMKVSGNAAEQQLQALEASTEYRVTIQSQLGDIISSEATTVFTTSSDAGKQGDSPRDLKASQVTPRTAVLSWKPPASGFTSYKLSYYTDGQDIKEVILDPTIKEYKLTRLHPMSTYTAQLQVERGGLHMTAISTEFTTGNLRFPFPTDCSQELQNGALESGIVEVFPKGKQEKPVMVYCDMETDGGGWTVFQRRKSGKTNFFRGWREYSRGFGELDEEFWLGNEQLHNFTQISPMMLRVDLKTGDESVYAQYSTFFVESQKKQYTITVSGYSGTAGDSMTYHDGRPFSTRDRDPRHFITRCAMSYKGGWWYKNCHEANLNGLYNTNTNHQGVIWTEWKGKNFSIPFTEMKFRPASFKP